jgi:hypothetical protein
MKLKFENIKLGQTVWVNGIKRVITAKAKFEQSFQPFELYSFSESLEGLKFRRFDADNIYSDSPIERIKNAFTNAAKDI